MSSGLEQLQKNQTSTRHTSFSYCNFSTSRAANKAELTEKSFGPTSVLKEQGYVSYFKHTCCTYYISQSHLQQCSIKEKLRIDQFLREIGKIKPSKTLSGEIFLIFLYLLSPYLSIYFRLYFTAFHGIFLNMTIGSTSSKKKKDF